MGLTQEQRSLITGTLLGDGAMRCKTNALLEINHCAAQKAYVDWKYGILRDLVRTPPRVRAGNGKRLAYRFTTLSLPALMPFYSAFYDGARKMVPELILTPLALAVWFMDDGCRSRRAVYLNTQQFDSISQNRMLSMLGNQYGIAATLNRDKEYFRIRVATGSMPRFAALVSPFLLPEMRYKLPD